MLLETIYLYHQNNRSIWKKYNIGKPWFNLTFELFVCVQIILKCLFWDGFLDFLVTKDAKTQCMVGSRQLRLSMTPSLDRKKTRERQSSVQIYQALGLFSNCITLVFVFRCVHVYFVFVLFYFVVFVFLLNCFFAVFFCACVYVCVVFVCGWLTIALIINDTISGKEKGWSFRFPSQ